MKGSIFAASTATALVLCASPAIADHNSPHGPGWANMPNDIHNTRVETLDSNDNEAFRDFVKYGEGADSVNSENPPDENTVQRVKEQKGKATTEQTEAKQQAGERKNARVQDRRQIRPEGGPGASDRQRSMRERDTGYRAGNRGGDRQRERGGRGRN
jgi:hypothetical protein